MLKIKDDVDLKELEKFGFILWDDEYYGFADGKFHIKIYLKDRLIFPILSATYALTHLFEFTNMIFDLIQAGLVEKVEKK